MISAAVMADDCAPPVIECCLDAEMDGGPGSMEEEEASEMKESKEVNIAELDEEEKLRKLVDLQEFNGCFALTETLAGLMGTELDKLSAGLCYSAASVFH
jgi:hypothetical protein